MKNPRVLFLSLVILALVAILAKTMMSNPAPPAANNFITSPTTPAPASVEAPMASETATPLANDATVAAAAPADVTEDGVAVSKVPEATKEKIELAKSTWVGTWGRQLPDPNSIDMDMSQVGKPGGKAIPIPYVAPAPLIRGMTINNPDGSVSTAYDGVIVRPDGSKAKIEDANIVDSDGALLGVRIGNEILWTDGSKSSY